MRVRRPTGGVLIAALLVAAGPAAAPARAGTPPRPLAGDFDGDGRRDLLRYAESGGRATVWFGHADRRLRSEGLLAPPGSHPVVGDFDGDGRDDVFWYGRGETPDRVWYGGADQGFDAKPFRVGGAYAPVVGDFDGDDRDDVLWYRAGEGRDYVWWGLEGRRFGQSTVVKSGTSIPVPGDFDGDGRTDVLWRDASTTHSVWYGGADRRFVARAVSGASGRPLVGDFNGDLVDDVLWYAPGVGRGALVWIGTRVRDFVSHPVEAAGGFRPFVVDLDGDRRDDVFWRADDAGPGTVWFGAAGIVFLPGGSAVTGTAEPVVADLDGDGAEDVVWYDGTLREVTWGRPDRTVARTPLETVANRVAALRPEAMREGYDPFGYVAHAMGPIDGNSYTNSKEAFLANYAAGYRVFEVDFVRLRDGHVVAAHDGIERQYGLDRRFRELTWPEVRGRRLNGRYRVMDGAEVLELFRTHRDAYLVTDAKWDNVEILRALLTSHQDPHLARRILPHVEGQADLDAVRRFFPLQNYVMALYRTQFRGQYDDDEVLRFVRRNGTPGVMMWHQTRDRSKSLAQNGRESRRYEPEFARALQEAGAVVYVHSIKDPARMTPFRTGAVGVYSDAPYPGIAGPGVGQPITWASAQATASAGVSTRRGEPAGT